MTNLQPCSRRYGRPFISTISSTNTSARIATPSSRKSGRFTAPVILCGGGRLAGDAFRGGGGEPADAERGADDDHAEAERGAEQVKHRTDCRRRGAASCAKTTELDASATAATAATNVTLTKTVRYSFSILS